MSDLEARADRIGKCVNGVNVSLLPVLAFSITLQGETGLSGPDLDKPILLVSTACAFAVFVTGQLAIYLLAMRATLDIKWPLRLLKIQAVAYGLMLGLMVAGAVVGLVRES